MSNLPPSWRPIVELEKEIEQIVDGDLTTGLNLTWDAAERCVCCLFRIYRLMHAPNTQDFAKMVNKAARGRDDPIERLVRYEFSNMHPDTKMKIAGVQNQIIAAIHLIDREIGDSPLPEDRAIILFIRDVCGGLEKGRLKWLHMVADEMRAMRRSNNSPARIKKMDLTSAAKLARQRYPKWPDLKIEGYAQALLDAPRAWIDTQKFAATPDD